MLVGEFSCQTGIFNSVCCSSAVTGDISYTYAISREIIRVGWIFVDRYLRKLRKWHLQQNNNSYAIHKKLRILKSFEINKLDHRHSIIANPSFLLSCSSSAFPNKENHVINQTTYGLVWHEEYKFMIIRRRLYLQSN